MPTYSANDHPGAALIALKAFHQEHPRWFEENKNRYLSWASAYELVDVVEYLQANGASVDTVQKGDALKALQKQQRENPEQFEKSKGKYLRWAITLELKDVEAYLKSCGASATTNNFLPLAQTSRRAKSCEPTDNKQGAHRLYRRRSCRW